jgi:hypothetical protein
MKKINKNKMNLLKKMIKIKLEILIRKRIEKFF